MSKSSLLLWEQGVDYWFDPIVDKSFKDLIGDAEQRDGTVALWVPTAFESLGIATTSAHLQTFGILSWCQLEERKPRSQDFKSGPAWITSSGLIELGPELYLVLSDGGQQQIL